MPESDWDGDIASKRPRSRGRATMKDIATSLGVSINTVHKALTGKPGVSAAVRARVTSYAEQIGYHRNESASNLRRKTARVAICFPTPKEEGRYFYAYLWEGCHRFEERTRDAGFSFEHLEFRIGSYADSLRSLYERIRKGERIDGIVALAPTDIVDVEMLRSIANAGVPIELVNGDSPQTGRIGAVVADYAAAGRIMAEQTCNLMRGAESGARAFLLSGDPYIDSHYLVARAFHEYLDEEGACFIVEDLPCVHGAVHDFHSRLEDALGAHEPHVVCSVYAAGSEVLAKVLAKRCLTGKVLAIGSDLFPESAEALRSGVFTNIIYKDPVCLAERAMAALCGHLLRGKTDVGSVQMVPVDIVFKSNIDRYADLMHLDVS